MIGSACASDATPALEATPRAVVSPSTAPSSTATTPRTTAAGKAATPLPAAKPASVLGIEVFAVPSGSAPHDLAPARDGGVWYTAQRSGELGWLNPPTSEVKRVTLGTGSAPHGVIVGPDGAAWVTDGGLNAIVRVEEGTLRVTVYPLPPNRPNGNLNTAAFDGDGRLWFTGQAGIIGTLDPRTGAMNVFDAPRGAGPYGITGAPSGDVYFASLAGSYVGKIDRRTGAVTVLEPPTPGQGARRVWSDSRGRIWVSEWNAGQVAVYDPSSGAWREWKLPGARPQAYAVYVDESDMVWVTDWGANALVRFDPTTERFDSFPMPHTPSNVRQLLRRPGEVWAPESAADRLVVVR
jgi:virginiamycin B lyase